MRARSSPPTGCPWPRSLKTILLIHFPPNRWHIWPYIWPYMALCIHCLVQPVVDQHTRMKSFFALFCWQRFEARCPSFGPPWLSPGLPASGLTPSTRGNRVSTNFRSNNFLRPRENRIYLAFLPPWFVSDGFETLIKRYLEILHIPTLAACQTELGVQFYDQNTTFHPNVAVKTASSSSYAFILCALLFQFLPFLPQPSYACFIIRPKAYAIVKKFNLCMSSIQHKPRSWVYQIDIT